MQDSIESIMSVTENGGVLLLLCPLMLSPTPANTVAAAPADAGVIATMPTDAATVAAMPAITAAPTGVAAAPADAKVDHC